MMQDLSEVSTELFTNDIQPQDLQVFLLADPRYEAQFSEVADLVAWLFDTMVSEARDSFRAHSDPDDIFPYIAERELCHEALKLFRARWTVAVEDALDSHRREREK